MSDAPVKRRYVFRGHIRTLVNKNAVAESSYTRQYAMAGVLRFYGKRVDGSPIEVKIEDEPSNPNKRYPAKSSSRGDAEDLGEDDTESGAADEDEYRPDAPVVATNTNVVQTRKSCVLIVNDDERLPMAHVGMNLCAVLERQKKLDGADANGVITYRDYEYGVVSVRWWKMPERADAALVTYALGDAYEMWHNDRIAFDASAALAASGVLVNSRQAKRELAAIAQSKAVELTGYAAALAYGPQQNPGCAISIRTLCSSSGRTDAARDVIQTLGNYYALSQSVMHTTLPPGVSSADIMNDLRLQPREAACISCAELTALHNLYVLSSKTSGHMLLFAGARNFVPLFARGNTVIDKWAGLRYTFYKDRSLTVKLRNYLREELKDQIKDLDAELANEIIQLAYQLHERQQDTRYTEIFDAAALLKKVVEMRARRSEAAVSGDLFDAAIKFLLHTGAWCRVPKRTRRQLALERNMWGRRVDERTLWCTTERTLALLRALADAVQQLDPVLVLSEHTGADVPLRSDTLYLYSAGAVVPANDAVVCATQTMSVHAFLAHGTNSDNEFQHAVELLTFGSIVVYDTHMLDTVALTRLLALLVATKKIANEMQFELHGVETLPSAFAELVTSARFRTVHWYDLCSDVPAAAPAVARTMHDEYDEVFGPSGPRKPDYARVLRRACIEMMHASSAAAGRRLFVETLSQHVAPADGVGVEPVHLLDGKHKRVRWLLTCNSFAEAQKVYTALRTAAELLDTSAGNELATRFRVFEQHPIRIENTLFFISPYIGFLGCCTAVEAVYTLVETPDRGYTVTEECVQELRPSSTLQTVSLDCPQLYVKLDILHRVDHRVCCHTWAPNVMHVAQHRADVTNQSFIMVRDALPLKSSMLRPKKELTTAVFFAGQYRLDDVYRTFAHAALAFVQRYHVFGFTADSMHAALMRRYPTPHSLLVDLLAKENK